MTDELLDYTSKPIEMSTYVPHVIQELQRYLTPVGQLRFGEYSYTIELELTGVLLKKGRVSKVKYKYETETSLFKILTALLNTCGGVIHIIPRIPQKPLGDQDFDEWRNGFKEKLKFLPEDAYLQCISMHIERGQVYMLVHKANQFITYDAHLHTRGTSENCQVMHHAHLSHLVNRSGKRSESANVSTLPLSAPIKYMGICPEIESKSLEFKCYRYRTVDSLLDQIKQDRTPKAIFGMGNLDEGGDVIFGVQEDPTCKHNIYCGQELEENKEQYFKNKLQAILTIDIDGKRRIWGSQEVIPVEGQQWSCRFIPLEKPPYYCSPRCETCPHNERRVIIVIHVFHCPGGVFDRKPEAFTINDNGYIEEISFGHWQQKHTRGQTKPAENNIAGPRLPPQATCGDCTTIKYSTHSSGWNMHGSNQFEPGLLSHPENCEICRTAHPIRYTPGRDTLKKVLSDDALLSMADQEVGKPGFGFATESLWECLVTCSDISGISVGTRSRPNSHIMDLLVLDEMGALFLFVLCSVNETRGKSQRSYAVSLSRILKRRILEAIPPDADYAAVSVRSFVITAEVRTSCSSHFYRKWFTPSQTNVKYICMALRKVFSNMQSCFRNIITKDNNIELSKLQMDTLLGIDTNKFNIIEGPPGCGKTLLAQHICMKFEKQNEGSAVYMSASTPLNNRVKYSARVDVHLASSSEEIYQLLQGDLKEIHHIVIDDNHNISYSEQGLHKICELIAKKENSHLYIFQDSMFQQYQPMTKSVDVKQFIVNHVHLYGSISIKHMNEIRRNTQVVGSFIRNQVSNLVSGTKTNEIKCLNLVKGDDVFITHVKHLRICSEDNGLLSHVKNLMSTSINAQQRYYTTRDIAILVDHKDSAAVEKEVRFFKTLFETYWREAHVQSAERVPVDGIIIDRLENFMGLESRVVIFVAPKAERFSEYQSDKVKTKYRIAIASRGVDRVDFLQEDNILGKVLEDMKCDMFPAVAIQTGEVDSPTEIAGLDAFANDDDQEAEETLEQIAPQTKTYSSSIIRGHSSSVSTYSTLNPNAPTWKPKKPVPIIDPGTGLNIVLENRASGVNTIQESPHMTESQYESPAKESTIAAQFATQVAATLARTPYSSPSSGLDRVIPENRSSTQLQGSYQGIRTDSQYDSPRGDSSTIAAQYAKQVADTTNRSTLPERDRVMKPPAYKYSSETKLNKLTDQNL